MSVLPVGIAASGDEGYTIDNSLRFRSSASADLSRTFTTPTDNKKWTLSCWVKRGKLGALQTIIGGYASGTGQFPVYFTSSDTLAFYDSDGVSVYYQIGTSSVFRDTSAWYHIVVVFDSANATQANRLIIYVNSVSQTLSSIGGSPGGLLPLNRPSYFNASGAINFVGCYAAPATTKYGFFDGYLTEINFIDGQALDPTDFGEFDDTTGVWKPKEYTGTYGTNGFYLPTTATTQADGFNTVLYTGTGSTQSIGDVGFSPDLVWIKSRTSSGQGHRIIDTVRGAPLTLKTHTTDAEYNDTTALTSFNTDGFTLGSLADVNNSGDSYVAWCWDAGSGSPASNTDGSITSTVKANTATGFSIVSYTGDGSSTYSVGHGLGTTPSMVIIKNRTTSATYWPVYHASVASTYLLLNTTNAGQSGHWFAPDADTINFSSLSTWTNTNGNNYIAYCFSEVSGVSKFGSYTGTGVAGLSVTTGFRPAFVMIKRSDSTSNWHITDDIRSPSTTVNSTALRANTTDTETTVGTAYVKMTDTGFEITGTSTETNASGGTYIYMAFADTRDAQFNFDASGNKNNWIPNNINSNASSESSYDIMTDVPTLTDEYTANYCTLNPLVGTHANTYSNGNLQVATSTSNAAYSHQRATFGLSSGKWYWEITCQATSSAFYVIGITADTVNPDSQYVGQGDSYCYRSDTGQKATAGTFSSYGATFTTGDIIGVEFDADAGTLVFYKNGTSQGTAFSSISGTYFPAVSDLDNNTGRNSTFVANFGQRPFKYTPPTGFLPLNTYNLPDSTIKDGSEYMDVYTSTGTGTTRTDVIAFQPDLVWTKTRNTATNGFNIVQDSVRGAGNRLITDGTYAESYDATYGSFTSTGFQFGSNLNINTSGNTYVDWFWKANGSGVSNTDGSITSTVSANTTSGFSIVSYTPSGTASDTVGHGLNQQPELLILKRRSGATEDWYVFTDVIDGTNDYLRLNTTAAVLTSSMSWNSNTFTAWTANLDPYIAYCFASVEGFSKFGSYTGNGSTDGPFIYTGFRPRWLMYKRTDSTGQWNIIDTARNPSNQLDTLLRANLTNADETNAVYAQDFTANGWKIRSTNVDINVNGASYIYAAFAENPFKNSLAR